MRLFDNPEDHRFIAMANDLPANWNVEEMSREDLAHLLAAVHTAAIVSMRLVATAAGVSVSDPAALGASISDFAQEILDEMAVRGVASSSADSNTPRTALH